jgi:hypothetical protein
VNMLKKLTYLLVAAFIVIGGVQYFRYLQKNRPPDFVPFYLGGKMVFSGHIQRLYDKAAYEPFIAQFVQEGGRRTRFENYYFIRPPFQAFFYVPFSWFSYPTASALNVLLNFLLLGMLVWKLPVWFEVNSPLLPIIRLCLLIFFPFHWSITVGQDTLLLTMIIAYSFRLAAKGKDVLAGLLLGLGAYKPHLIWLLPLALIAERRWKMLFSFVAMGCGLALVSLAAVGPDGIRQWITLVQDPSSDISPPIMGNIRALGLHFGPIASGVAVGLVVVCLWLVLRRGKAQDGVTACLFAAILLSPHAYWQDYSLAAIVAMLTAHPAAQVLLLTPWPYFYNRLDELPMIFLSLAWLAAIAAKPYTSSFSWRLALRNAKLRLSVLRTRPEWK